MVEAEEQPSIEAKGIRREIRPFALRHFLDEAKRDGLIQFERDGVSVRVDLERMSDENRRNALALLSGIVDRLRR